MSQDACKTNTAQLSFTWTTFWRRQPSAIMAISESSSTSPPFMAKNEDLAHLSLDFLSPLVKKSRLVTFYHTIVPLSPCYPVHCRHSFTSIASADSVILPTFFQIWVTNMDYSYIPAALHPELEARRFVFGPSTPYFNHSGLNILSGGFGPDNGPC